MLPILVSTNKTTDEHVTQEPVSLLSDDLSWGLKLS